jgi:hypothetical protein
MALRLKSINDMQAQASRMYKYHTYTSARDEKVENAYNRYMKKIQSNLGYKNTGKGIEALNILNMKFSNPKYQSIESINKAKVPRSFYMGTSNG